MLSYSGWQDYDISDGNGLVKLGDNPEHPSWALGVMGMPGFTAYMGLLDIGQPKAGETLVVAAATGPVGATVGQIGKLKGCRVIGLQAGQRNADMPPRSWALMSASITTHKILRNSWQKPVRRGSISTTKTSAARYLTPFCHYSIPLRAFRCADWSAVTTPHRFQANPIDYLC